MKRIGAHVSLVVLAALTTFFAGPKDADAGIFAVWARTHGTVAAGQGLYFDGTGGPYLGFGGQVGVRVLFLESYVDINYFDNEPTTDGGNERTYYNQIGGGVRFGLPIPLPIDIRLRANANYLYAPYVQRGGFVSSGGLNFRAGGTVEYGFGKFGAIGVDVFAAYAPLGNGTAVCGSASCPRRDIMGAHGTGQLYLSFTFP